MARTKSKHPTALELELLNVLWESSPLTVREVRERLEAVGRKLAHTSLITTLNLMLDKGFVDRTEAGRGYAFAPAISRDAVSSGMVGDLVEKMFGGSAQAFLLSVLGNQKLSSSEREELKALIEESKGNS
ncbi:MAG: BlaI/MecI/CopY family transcriptional regulator [Opitutales bacterium]